MVNVNPILRFRTIDCLNSFSLSNIIIQNLSKEIYPFFNLRNSNGKLDLIHEYIFSVVMDSSVNLRNTQNLDQEINIYNNSAEEAPNKCFKKFLIDIKELEIAEESIDDNILLINQVQSINIKTKISLDQKVKFSSNKKVDKFQFLKDEDIPKEYNSSSIINLKNKIYSRNKYEEPLIYY